MKQFELTMMCTACKWKITQELEKKGYQGITIDMETSVLTFPYDVNSQNVINIVNGIGYKIEELPENEELSDEELVLLEDAIRNGYLK